jgi:hypothetical protein
MKPFAIPYTPADIRLLVDGRLAQYAFDPARVVVSSTQNPIAAGRQFFIMLTA